MNELPIVIPLVIYHGSDEWNIKTTLGEMIKDYKELPDDVKKYIPDYEYLLYDISRYTDEEIKGAAINRIILTTFRNIMNKNLEEFIESIVTSAKYLKELEDRQTGIEYFKTLLRYIFNAKNDITKHDSYKIIKRIEFAYAEGSEEAMTLAEIFRQEGLEEGLQKGKQEGLQEGRQEERKKTLIRLLTKKFGKLPKEITNKISKLDPENLEAIIDNIFDYESLEDVKKYI